MSTIQIRLIENKEKTTMAIHQEKLLNFLHRAEIKDYWNEIIGIQNKIANKQQCP